MYAYGKMAATALLNRRGKPRNQLSAYQQDKQLQPKTLRPSGATAMYCSQFAARTLLQTETAAYRHSETNSSLQNLSTTRTDIAPVELLYSLFNSENFNVMKIETPEE